MRTIARYACEICNTEYTTPTEALACEALGLPEPMPWLPLDRAIPAFGENGVEWASIDRIYIVRGHHCHAWMASTDPYIGLSHNQTENDIYIDAFDPRAGWDMFRYSATPEDLAIWQRCMREYGLKMEDVGEWAKGRIEKALGCKP
jgi:hypothetical protein